MTQSLPPKCLVLYADDDSDDLALITEAFRVYDYVIDFITFSDGVELLNYVEGMTPFHPGPCLVILDINMPRMNGKDVLRQLRIIKHFEETPVVLFSTSTMPAEAAFAQQFNAGFVTKPLTEKQYRQVADQLLSHCSDEVRKRFNRR